jgi:hypothetical protein
MCLIFFIAIAMANTLIESINVAAAYSHGCCLPVLIEADEFAQHSCDAPD